jgi:integrase/recombinase XerD
LRGGAEVARQAHNLEVVGSNPTPATIKFSTIEPGTTRFARPQTWWSPVSPVNKKNSPYRSHINIHVALSSLWTWAVVEDFADQHVMRNVPRPRPETRAVNPFTEQDIRALLEACDYSNVYTRPSKRACNNTRPTALRDRAIILLLLDTGMRASELCELTLQAVDLKNRRTRVFGKGSKERILRFSPTTGRALWRYINQHRQDAPANAPLFITRGGTPYNRGALRLLTKRLGERAGVPDCHPHRFRHTFAIQFLRNNGTNIFALQAALGHTSLDMVKKYLAIIQADLDTAYETASPVANWKL